MKITPSLPISPQRLFEALERAERQQQPTVVLRRGAEVAAIVPIGVFRQWQVWDQQWTLHQVDEDRYPSVIAAEARRRLSDEHKRAIAEN